MKIRPVGAELFHADGETGAWTEERIARHNAERVWKLKSHAPVSRCHIADIPRVFFTHKIWAS